MDDEKEVQVPEEENQVQDESSQEADIAPDGPADSPDAEQVSSDAPAEGEDAEMPDISEGVDPVPEQSSEAEDGEAESAEAEAPAEGGEENPEFSNDEMASMTDEEKAMLMSMDDVPEEGGGSGSNGLLSQEDLDAAMMEAADAQASGTGGLLDSADIPQANEGKDFGNQDSPGAVSEPQTPVNKAEFQQLSPAAAGEGKPRNIDLLMDVDLPVSIELGRTRMNISDILSLSPGSVVELDKLVGEPVDLLVNQKTVARGEVVVVEENFGLRITELLSAEERIKNLE